MSTVWEAIEQEFDGRDWMSLDLETKEFMVNFLSFGFIIIMNKIQTSLHKYILKNDLRLDFNRLATQHPQLYSHLLILEYKTVINFKNQNSLRVLNEAIMKCIFQLRWHCPYNNLCPRVPNRLNYLLWIHKYSDIEIRNVLDIGTGSTIIYPLLGFAIFKWKFIGTETDLKSVQHAENLIQDNNLKDFIQIRNVQKQTFLKEALKENDEIDIVICNPPFFDEKEDHSPVGVMTKSEFCGQGGQYEFWFNLYRESFCFPKILRFSCLLGRKSDFEEIRAFLTEELDERIVETVKFGEIQQGNNTRFIVMWKPYFN